MRRLLLCGSGTLQSQKWDALFGAEGFYRVDRSGAVGGNVCREQR